MIVRVRRRAERPFVVLETATLRMRALSLKARGLWALCMSYPDDWEFTRAHLERQSERDGREAVQGALQELAAAHLASLEVVRAGDGRMRGSRWTIYEAPELCPSYTGERVSRQPVTDERVSRQPVTDERVFRQPVTGERVFRQPGNPHLRSKEVVRSKEVRSKDALRKKQQQQRARACARGGEGAFSGQLSAVSLKTAALPAAAFSIDEERAGAAAALSSEDLPSGDALPADRLPAERLPAMLPAAAAFSKEEDQGKVHLVELLVERGLDEAVARRLVGEAEAEHVRAMLARGAREAAGPGWYVRAIEQGYRAGARDGPSGERRYTRAEALALLERRGVVLSQLNPLHRYFDVVRGDGRAYFVERDPPAP